METSHSAPREVYVGDCKMTALATRAELVAEGDYYLMPLPMTGDTQNQFEGWLDQLASGKVKTQELWDDQEGPRVPGTRLGVYAGVACQGG